MRSPIVIIENHFSSDLPQKAPEPVPHTDYIPLHTQRYIIHVWHWNPDSQALEIFLEIF